MKSKIKSRMEIVKIANELRAQKKTIVTTCGAFDMLHAGHLSLLQKARSFGDALIVCLNADVSVKQYKSDKRPIIPQEQRANMLAGLECVDYIVMFDEPTPNNLLPLIRPDIHVKSKTGYKGTEKDAIEKNGGKIQLVDDLPGVSTTRIIEKILDIYK